MKHRSVGLVIHAEAVGNLTNDRHLTEFGESLGGRIRPVLAVVPPMNPEYKGDAKGFDDSLKRLWRFYQIGYHGHFKSPYANIGRDIAHELEFFNRNGFKPKVYAGGWWIINPIMVIYLTRFGFRIDTTLNDVHEDSLGHPQPELPDMLKEVITVRQSMRIPNSGEFCLSFHDYDLSNDSWKTRWRINHFKKIALLSEGDPLV